MKLITFVQADLISRLGTILVWVAAILLLVVVIALGLVLISRRQKRLGQLQYQLKITNHGNLRCNYELQAQDPAKVLTFSFLLNGVELPRSARNVLTRRAVPAPKPGPRPSKPPPKPRPKKSGFGKKSRQFGKTSGVIASILLTIGNLLPSSMGSGAYSAGSKMRQAQIKTTQANRLTSEVGKVSKGPKPETSKERVVTPETGSTQQMPDVRAQPSVSQSTTTAPQQTVVRENWVQTPYITPGETLALDLLVKPRNPRQSQHYTFKVISRNIEQEETEEKIELSNIDFKGITWLKFTWPYFALGVLVLAFITATLSILLTYFRI
jgi:hypothetical protein